jgi:uncharacterized protein (TIGR03435 family)
MKRTMVGMACAVLLAGGAQMRGQDRAAAPMAAQSAAAQSGDLTGTWQGTITPPNPNATGARIEMKVTKEGAQGAPYKGTLYQVDLGLNGRAMAAPAIAVHGAQVSFSIPQMGTGMIYSGTLTADSKTMVGALSAANGPPIPLNLSLVPEDAAWPIAQFASLMAKDAHPKFDVLTVKPSRPEELRGGPRFSGHETMWTAFTVEAIIGLGYGLHPSQFAGEPDWFRTDRWDVVGIPDTPGRPSPPQFDELSHDLLATRFGMKFHMEQRELTAYVITVAKGGPKLLPTASGPTDSGQINLRYGSVSSATIHNMTVANFAKWFQTDVLDRPVIDRTGLTGFYDFTLKWTPDESQFPRRRQNGAAMPSFSDGMSEEPALNEAAERQLGLKIERIKTMVPVMVIDHAEKPGEN